MHTLLVGENGFWMSQLESSSSAIFFKLLYTTSMAPTPVLLPGKSHGRRSLVSYSPWGLEESDTTEQLHFHFSLSCIGEGNGNPLQCSCLENPRDEGAWWAAQSRTRLKQLSSSSSSSIPGQVLSLSSILKISKTIYHFLNVLKWFSYAMEYWVEK